METSRRSGPEMLYKLSLSAGAVVGMLVLFEVGLRAMNGISPLRATNFIRDGVDPIRIHTHAMYDETLGWRVKPNYQRTSIASGKTVSYSSDAYGNRLPGGLDRPLPQHAILAVGDSFTAGEEVSDAESWPAFLESLTGAPVVNAGCGAWGTDQIVMRAGQMIDVAHPKTLILSFFWRDIERAEFASFSGAYKPYYTVDAGKLTLHNVPVPRYEGGIGEPGPVRNVLGYSYLAVWVANRIGFTDWLRSWAVSAKRATPEGTGTGVTCQLLKQSKERTDREQIRSLVVMEYSSQDFGSAKPAQASAVLACARDLGYELVDIWDRLADVHASDKQRFRSMFVYHEQDGTLGHMSAEGNRLVATEVAARMRDTTAH
jgi:hypothetical protein